MKKLPIGIQTFEKIRQNPNEFVYVDKTREVYDLVNTGSVYFLSRPRRFGKSLLCSTLKSLFEGRRDLFEGLWIAKTNWKWQQHPIIHISFAGVMRKNPEELKRYLSKELVDIGKKNNISTLDETLSPGYLLRQLTEILHQQAPVVIIVDEYDKPILDHITNLEIAQQMREILKELYEAIKDLDQYLRFVFITGVTKFSKTSIFSGINNLQDVSLHPIAKAVCGFSHDEIMANFQPFIQALTEKRKWSHKKTVEQLRNWYNGYRFDPEDDSVLVYNPFSILNVFSSKRFQNYWFASGTPTFLIELIKKNNYPILDFHKIALRESDFDSIEIEKITLPTLMAQTGYLTIVNHDREKFRYTLSFPNFEVFKSLSDQLTDLLTPITGIRFDDYVAWFRQAMNDGDINHFCKTLQQFFTEIPYPMHLKNEKYYQTIFFIICRLLTRHVWVEQATNTGRVDAVLEFEQRVVIIEFKVNYSAAVAMEQIEKNLYASPYLRSGKEILVVGISFDVTKRNIAQDWEIKKLQ